MRERVWWPSRSSKDSHWKNYQPFWLSSYGLGRMVWRYRTYVPHLPNGSHWLIWCMQHDFLNFLPITTQTTHFLHIEPTMLESLYLSCLSPIKLSVWIINPKWIYWSLYHNTCIPLCLCKRRLVFIYLLVE